MNITPFATNSHQSPSCNRNYFVLVKKKFLISHMGVEGDKSWGLGEKTQERQELKGERERIVGEAGEKDRVRGVAGEYSVLS